MPVGQVGDNTLIIECTKYLAFSPEKHSAVLIPVRLENISFDCKINMSSWSTRLPNTVLITSFVPVRLPVRLGNINSDKTSDYNTSNTYR